MPAGNLFREMAEAALREAGHAYRIAYEGNSIPAVEAAAAAGIGIAVVKQSTAREDLVLLDAKDGLPRLAPVGIVLHESETSQTDAAVKSLRKYLVQAFAGSAG